MITTQAYAATSSDTPLSPFTFERRALRDDDVQIEILFCGVCHTDLHQARNHWGNTTYPLVPGHEIVGIVTNIGAQVSKFSVGDTVAVGCLVDSCQDCDACHDHEEQYCHHRPTQTYGDKDRVDGMPTQGGYSDCIIVREAFVLRLPESLNPAAAAPLLCAGITTYSPLHQNNVGAGTRVGVIGLGGLGHMAIKFAVAMGAEVTLFTTSDHKVDEGKRLGARNVILSKDNAQMQSVMGYFDLIIDTVPEPHPMSGYLMTLRRGGKLALVGPIGMIDSVHSGLLMSGRKSITGSAIGGIAETQAMLDFCGTHNISSDIEIISIQNIENAYARMENNDVHYRFVIDMASLKATQ
jgi:uncharacterized zinc-type alcohol dehydrogenase-like protein